MAYHLHYNITFQNRITENIRIELYKKDVEVDEAESLKALSLRRSYPKGDGDKFDNIIGCELSFDLWLRVNDTPEFHDFLVTYNDEWKVIVYSDEQVEFAGFLTPGEGEAEFQNKPYQITLNATDGLGLLKGVELTAINGDDFEGINLISDYLVAIFSKTGLELPIRMFSSWIEESMSGRLADPDKDTFNQTGLHKRTFLNDKVDFYDCYESLRRITQKGFIVYQWAGMWVVLNVGEMQANPGPMLWYTDYDSAGTVTGSGQLGENPCPIGIDKIIHPRDRTHRIGSLLSIRSAKHNFNYIPPPELINNQDLSQLGAFIAPLSGTTHRAWQLVGWSQRQGELRAGTPYAGTKNAYIKTDIDVFGNETFRYYRIEADNALTNTLQNYIKNDNADFWVVTNDRFDISLTYRVSTTILSAQDIMIVALLIDGQPGTAATDWYTLGENGEWLNNDTTVAIDHDIGASTNKWISIDIEADPFPADGVLFICLGTGNAGSTPTTFDFKAPNISYRPFFSDPLRTFLLPNITPGVNFFPVVITNPTDTAPKGDYWFTEQDVPLQDKIDEEVYLSDTSRKSIKGALFRGTTSVLTTTTWHRDNVTEERHFKELINMARFNHAYRRMWKCRGFFSGLKWQPSDDTTIFEPLGFHRHFFFPDKSALTGKYFMLVPPLTINHDSGTFDGTFVECLDTSLVEGITGVTPEQVAYQLATLINDTSVAEWDSEGNAPAPGTMWFPPTASVIGDILIITMNSGDNAFGSANHGGVGNSPSLTETSNLVIASKRIVRFQPGADIQPGNVFTIAIYGHEVSFTSSSVLSYQDGNQEGDTHSYSIFFK